MLKTGTFLSHFQVAYGEQAAAVVSLCDKMWDLHLTLEKGSFPIFILLGEAYQAPSVMKAPILLVELLWLPRKQTGQARLCRRLMGSGSSKRVTLIPVTESKVSPSLTHMVHLQSLQERCLQSVINSNITTVPLRASLGHHRPDCPSIILQSNTNLAVFTTSSPKDHALGPAFSST